MRGYEDQSITPQNCTTMIRIIMHKRCCPNTSTWCCRLLIRLSSTILTGNRLIHFVKQEVKPFSAEATCSSFSIGTDGSVEVKVVEGAQQKLKLDAIVVQQGRLQEKEKKMSKLDLLDTLRFGADKIFRSKESTITDDCVRVTQTTLSSYDRTIRLKFVIELNRR